MYEDGKILVSGGGEDFPTDAVEVIDSNSPAPTTSPTAQPMGSRASTEHYAAADRHGAGDRR